MHRLLPLLLLALTGSTTLSAQQRPEQWAHWQPTLPVAAESAPHSLVGLAAGGVVGGALGIAAGGLIGAAAGHGNSICGDDACGLEAAAYGAIIGESVMLPLGVHLANGRQGNYLLSLLASSAIGAAGILAVDAADDGAPLIAVPVAQLVTSILIERGTTRR